jgi:hypothetical protein
MIGSSANNAHRLDLAEFYGVDLGEMPMIVMAHLRMGR